MHQGRVGYRKGRRAECSKIHMLVLCLCFSAVAGDECCWRKVLGHLVRCCNVTQSAAWNVAGGLTEHNTCVASLCSLRRA